MSKDTIHPADLAFIRGQYRVRPQFPQIAGLEGVGTVLEAGAKVKTGIGAKVAFRWPGSWAEQVVVPEERLIAVPSDVPNETASQISLNPATAWGLLDEAGVGAGSWILLTAAASTVSNLIGAIARHRGIRVIGLVRGNPNEASTRCTADAVFSSKDPNVVDNILSGTGGSRIAALLDSVGGPIVPKLFGTLEAGARVIAYGVQEREPATVTNAMLIYSNLTWKGFGIDRWLSQLPTQASLKMHKELWSMIHNGILKLPVASSYRLDSIRDALAANTQQERMGKILLI